MDPNPAEPTAANPPLPLPSLEGLPTAPFPPVQGTLPKPLPRPSATASLAEYGGESLYLGIAPVLVATLRSSSA